MTAIVAIGEEALLAGYALVGVAVVPADGERAARAAFATLPVDAGLVLLTPAALDAIGRQRVAALGVPWAVVPA
jgi:vacuolar-type H+-ATPase subunit F/Vma7